MSELPAKLLFWAGLSALVASVPARAQEEESASEPAPDEEVDSGREGAASFKIETVVDQTDVDKSDQAAQKRDESIQLLKELIPRADDTRKAEMIFRLAELYWEKSKFEYNQEFEDFEKAYQAWAESGQRGSPPERASFIRESELIKDNALNLYERVLNEYPRYERNDEVLFYLGYNEYEAANTEKAVDHYLQLIKQFPQSRLVDDAYLQLGEHYFNNNRLGQAQRAYQKASESDEPRIYNYAIYKLAWCDYNYQDYAAGIKKMKRVIDNAEVVGADKKSVELKSEALNDLARFFSYVDEVDTAFAYFKAKGGEEIAVRYTERLGNLFGDQGKWPLQVQTFRLLIDRYPMSERSPHLQSKIVAAYSQLEDKSQVRTEVERLVDLYRPGTPWYKHHENAGESGAAALEYAYDLTETSLRNLVTEYHRDAQKRQNVETYYLARDIYAKYLDAFSETKAAYEMRYFYAEVLWALLEWKNAALQYDQIARAETNDTAAQKKYQREAAYNQILAYEKIIKEKKDQGDPTTQRKVKEAKDKGQSKQVTRVNISLSDDKEYPEEAIPANELSLAAACDLYFGIADEADKELPAIKFKAAFVYFDHNHFSESAKRFFEMIEKYPRDKLAKRSAYLILDSLGLQKKWDELAFYAGKFKTNDKLVGNDKKFAKEVQELLEGSTYLSIQTAEIKAKALDDGDEKEAAYAAVASRFSKFQEDFATSDYADEATFSAVLIYNNADELDHAIKMAEIFRKTYEPKVHKKKSKLTRRSKKEAREAVDKEMDIVHRNHLLLAEFYERIADFSTSATLYDEFFTDYPGHEKASVALYNAAVYRQGLGDTDDAIAKFTTYYTDHAKGEEAAEVYWRVCELQETKKDWESAAGCYDRFRKRYANAGQAKIFESRYKFATLVDEKLGKRRDAMKEYAWIVQEFPNLKPEEQKKEGAQLAGAHARFELLEPEFQSFSKISFTRLSPKILKSKLGGAQTLACVSTDEAKCEAEGKYLDVLTYGNGDYGICALTRIGQVYRNVADTFRNAPLPKRLTFDQQEIYRAELDAQALGPEEKGLQAFERALDKAYELNIYNECTLTAQENLKELNPDKFPELQKPGYEGADVFIMSKQKPADLVPDEVIEEVIEPANAEGEDARAAAESQGRVNS
ncbi:MAG: tetratricopeptide repeat protein [Myxococcota bacterium]